VTALLLAWSEGDKNALEALVPLVYDDLRRLARRHMRGERKGVTLQEIAYIWDDIAPLAFRLAQPGASESSA